MNKRGLIYENLIFIALNLTFFVVMLIFVNQTRDGIYEHMYAKRIALLIDEAKPGTSIIINLQKLSDKFKELKDKNFLDVVRIDEKEKRVIFEIKEPGYSYNYFNDAKIEIFSRGVNLAIRVGK